MNVPWYLKFLLPIPERFNDVYADIYPVEDGGFVCMRCNGKIRHGDWKDIQHSSWCTYSEEGKYSTHGEERAAFRKQKDKDQESE